jgi:glucokinase
MSGLLLAGDIGGTSTRLGLFEVVGGRPRVVVRERYGSSEHPGLDAIVRLFRQAHGQAIVGACFGVAGPVVGGQHVATPNLAWDVDATVIARELDQPQVGLINDLEANAHGIFTLEDKDFAVLNAGAVGAGNIAVISAGTGLGEAGMYWDGAQHHPFAGEGGHCDYAPHADLEVDLLRYLQAKFGAHVSWERVLSGPGLASIYAFLRDTGRGTEPDWLAEAIRTGDGPAVISRAALEGKSELCVKALDIFVAAYGDEASNLALKLMATGGVYLGGGIAPRIVDKLKGPAFMEAFTAKGRLGPLLATIPVRVIMNDETALLGAARYAALRAALIQPPAR